MNTAQIGFGSAGMPVSMLDLLIMNDMNPEVLRPNTLLQKDAWREMDTAVVGAGRQRLVGVADLLGRNLTYTIPNGLGVLSLEHEKVSDISPAGMSLHGISNQDADQVKFELERLPLPMIHKEFSLPARMLASSRRKGLPLDTTNGERAGRSVAVLNEDLLMNGSSSYKYDGGTIYGYTDHPDRNVYNISVSWATAGGNAIIQDVLAMKQMSIDDNQYGPWILYVPTNYDTVLDDDKKAESDKTIRQRILDIDGIVGVRTADRLTDSNVVLVQMQPETARIVNAQDTITVMWEGMGGMVKNFLVFNILIPQVRSDIDDKCGIVHGS